MEVVFTDNLITSTRSGTSQPQVSYTQEPWLVQGKYLMEEEWIVSRAQLQQLLQTHPEWSSRQYAGVAGRSLAWGEKWKKDPVSVSEFYRNNIPPRLIKIPVRDLSQIEKLASDRQIR